jgi:hypothetical protein
MRRSAHSTSHYLRLSARAWKLIAPNAGELKAKLSVFSRSIDFYLIAVALMSKLVRVKAAAGTEAQTQVGVCRASHSTLATASNANST